MSIGKIMGTTQALQLPTDEYIFERMCLALYKSKWNDPTASAMGGRGQSQFGVDILGLESGKLIGVQCKCYAPKTPFRLANIKEDVAKAEEAGLELDHLIFAVTHPKKSELVKEVHQYNASRLVSKKFTVSIDALEDLQEHLWKHPAVARDYIPNFPGSAQYEHQQSSLATLEGINDLKGDTRHLSATMAAIAKQVGVEIPPLCSAPDNGTPPSSGNPLVNRILDQARDALQLSRVADALNKLHSLAPEDLDTDEERFRWHTNVAVAALLEGRHDDAAAGFETAFSFAQDNPKAVVNFAYSFLLRHDPEGCRRACEDGLEKFPSNPNLLAIKVNARSELNDSAPDDDVPLSLQGDPDLLLARARAHEKLGSYDIAVELLERIFEGEDPGLAVKRNYLSTVLSWLIKEAPFVRNGRCPEKLKQAALRAVNFFEPLEDFVADQQSAHIAKEISNNAVAAIFLVGDKARAGHLAQQWLRRFPDVEAPLQVHIETLAMSRDWAEIHRLTDDRLADLSIALMGALADIALQSGSLEWLDRILAASKEKETPPNFLLELEAGRASILWDQGKRSDGMAVIERVLADHPDFLPARMLRAHFQYESGFLEEAKEGREQCRQMLIPNNGPVSVGRVADLFFEAADYAEAGELYERVAPEPQDDFFTVRKFICFIESDQRRRAREQFEKLPDEALNLPVFLRIRARLAEKMGDFDTVCRCFKREYELTPDNIQACLGYGKALYQLGKTGTLEALLSTAPKFGDADIADQAKLAGLQVEMGQAPAAIRRLYEVFKTNHADSQVASYFLFGMLKTSKEAFDQAVAVDGVVVPGSAVFLESPSGSQTIAIDFEAQSPLNQSWPELVLVESDTAQRMLGRSCGDEVILQRGMVEQIFKIACVEHIFSFAAKQAEDLITRSPSSNGPVWTAPAIDKNGAPDLQAIRTLSVQRLRAVEAAMEAYRSGRLTIGITASALGLDPGSLFLDWPADLSQLLVNTGTKDERDRAAKLLNKRSQRWVADGTALVELAVHGCLEVVLDLLSTVLIPKSVHSSLCHALEVAEQDHSISSSVDASGAVIFRKVPPATIEARRAFLISVIGLIEKKAEIVPVEGPVTSTDLSKLIQGLDAGSKDCLLLCLERKAAFISEDRYLRWLFEVAKVGDSVSVQPVLLKGLCDSVVSQEQFAAAAVSKVQRGHRYVSVRTADLMTLAAKNPHSAQKEVGYLINTFSEPLQDMQSVASVLVAFLQWCFSHLPMETGISYVKMIQAVFNQMSEEERWRFNELILRAIDLGAQRRPCAVTSRESRLFQLLVADLRIPYSQKKLVTAIRYTVVDF